MSASFIQSIKLVLVEVAARLEFLHHKDLRTLAVAYLNAPIAV
jgi:hypothetical protein